MGASPWRVDLPQGWEPAHANSLVCPTFHFQGRSYPILTCLFPGCSHYLTFPIHVIPFYILPYVLEDVETDLISYRRKPHLNPAGLEALK